MKTAKHLLFLVSMAFGVGCATDPAPVDPTSDQTEATAEQDLIPVGGSCTAWNNCYALCRVRFHCTSGPTCLQLSHCLDQCDNDYPSCPRQPVIV